MRILFDLFVILSFVGAIVFTGTMAVRSYNRVFARDEQHNLPAAAPSPIADMRAPLNPALPPAAETQPPALEAPVPPLPAEAFPKERLTREDVMAGLQKVAPDVKRCGTGTGVLKVNVLIKENGRVESVEAADEHAGTPLEACAAAAILQATFPPAEAKLRVKYPFKL